ncbi:DUF1877 family protein [Streptomyces sp. NPDC017958]|uniref:DUF1877 family protein n=1 Tax=Streptomyces sp. NPDC017958 TaxID=3365021 RepID=UPI00379D064C
MPGHGRKTPLRTRASPIWRSSRCLALNRDGRSSFQLIRGVDPAELTGAEVYPLGWSEPGALEWGRHWYDGLTQFFGVAAGADAAMLVWLD